MLQGNPGAPSRTYGFAASFSNADCLFEAFSRCRIRGTSLTQHHMTDGRRSLGLALQSFVNKGVNLFQLEQRVIELQLGVATYVLPPEIVSITDLYYNTIQSTGPGPDLDAPSYDPSQPIASSNPNVSITESTDRWLKPFGHADFARLPDKTSLGVPTNYWVNRLGPPAPTTITLYKPPSVGWPLAAVTYFGVRSIQDANLQNGETPDVVARFLDALVADVAHRVARKYSPELIGAKGSGGLLDDRDEAWDLAASEDTEKSEVFIRPSIGRYFRM
jgi:hypothetical protein